MLYTLTNIWRLTYLQTEWFKFAWGDNLAYKCEQIVRPFVKYLKLNLVLS